MGLGTHLGVRCHVGRRVPTTPHLAPARRVPTGLDAWPDGHRSWVAWHADFAAISAYRAETVWTPGPSPGEKVTLSILISGSDRTTNDITEVLGTEERILGSLPLKNGERVWLRARKSLMQASEIQGVMSVQREAIGFGASSLDGIEPWMVWETTTA